MSDSGTTQDSNEVRDSQFVGCSVKGPDHEGNGTPCQDSWSGKKLSDSRIVLAVADGLGSAEYSHIGSKIATDTLVGHLESEVSEVDTIDENSMRGLMREGFESAREALSEKAKEVENPVSELNTTLLATVGGPSGVVGAGVGDGGIVGHHNGSHDLIIPREDSKYANTTTPIQSDRWEDSYRIGGSKKVDLFAVFSDGLDQFTWDGRESVKDSFFGQIFNFAQSSEDLSQLQQEFRAFLNDDRFRKYSGDDKTIAVGVIPSDRDKSQIKQTDSKDRKESTAQTIAPNQKSSDSGVEQTGPVAKEREAENFAEKIVSTNSDTVFLTERLEELQDGCIYRVSGRDVSVAKIYTVENRNKSMEGKVRLLQKYNNEIESPRNGRILFQWPIELMGTYLNNKFLGCRLQYNPYSKTKNILEFAKQQNMGNEGFLSGVKETVSELPFFSEENLQRKIIALNLATGLKYIHENDMAVGNMSHENIAVQNYDVLFKNCDTFYLEYDDVYFKGSNKDSRYALREEPDNTLVQAKNSDLFGLGVHIFQLLLGTHPFESGDPSKKNFDSLINDARQTTERSSSTNHHEPEFSKLPDVIQLKFKECFIDGIDDPTARPKAVEWVRAMNNII
ncbi:protein phosphatase 2C domain-containing protein [Haloarcula sp. Atlit-120R]|uniref:protein phosphatase 2C domain-containing protein n=1 Tax=Haloarcula sp. Atlit-120R TaxID=2282135 RepID=UPI000EF1D81A|nr:protein phosphatase 2C domain-containing protein [Haloarcula sp. Atlit-120R]RLM32879.1 hypothetical protein DVK01_19520 [Haloarcula sp. Atlit-120R]